MILDFQILNQPGTTTFLERFFSIKGCHQVEKTEKKYIKTIHLIRIKHLYLLVKNIRSRQKLFHLFFIVKLILNIKTIYFFEIAFRKWSCFKKSLQESIQKLREVGALKNIVFLKKMGVFSTSVHENFSVELIWRSDFAYMFS